jgi:hypothetical protein
MILNGQCSVRLGAYANRNLCLPKQHVGDKPDDEP